MKQSTQGTRSRSPNSSIQCVFSSTATLYQIISNTTSLNALAFPVGCCTPERVDLPEKIASNIREHGLLSRGEHALVAVSAGPDSVALATALASMAAANDWSLRLAHFNHQLRGAESGEDARFVEQFGERLGLPVLLGQGGVASHASENRLSIEMAARQLRHRFFAGQAAATGSTKILLAHHADDQVELFWLRLLRGSASLAVMRWSNPSPHNHSITLARPLLNVPKAEILRYLERNSIPFREDSTNALPDFERNKLRLELLPAIEKVRPDFRQSTLRVAEVLAPEKDYITSMAREWLRLAREPFERLHLALQRESLRLQLIELNIDPTFDLIEVLRASPRAPISVGRNRAVVCADGRLTVLDQTPVEFSNEQVRLHLGDCGEIQWKGVEIAWEIVSERGSGDQTEYFDAGETGEAVILRHWQPGDRFQLIGMERAAKLQDIFINAKVPRPERRERVLAAAQGGQIFWVEGLRISEPFKVTSATRRILKWRWRRFR